MLVRRSTKRQPAMWRCRHSRLELDLPLVQTINMTARALLVDIHTHIYPPRYASYLRQRTSVPRILSRPTGKGNSETEERLVILNDEPGGGRPVGPQYWDRTEKLKFMDKHGIDISVISTANPWLDPIPASEAVSLAEDLNTDLEEFCSGSPLLSSDPSFKRLYGLGLLPLVSGVPIQSILDTISQVSSLPHLKGVIIGTRGLGKGLDDEALESVWEAIAKAGLVIFLHPHYGVAEGREWGEKANGHVLPLALGFPMETTIAITRLILSGVYDRHPSLKILLAHSGGCLPQLSSRLSSCVTHDPVVSGRLKHDVRWYLGKLWFDAVAYGPEELEFVSAVIGRAERHTDAHADLSVQTALTADAVQSSKREGSARMLWGTDHPFFPPLDGIEKWKSVVENLRAIDSVTSWSETDRLAVRGGNAIALFDLTS